MESYDLFFSTHEGCHALQFQAKKNVREPEEKTAGRPAAGEEIMEKGAVVLIALAGITWGTIGVFVRGLNADGVSGIDAVMVRALFTSVLMAVVLLVRNRRLFRIRWRDL